MKRLAVALLGMLLAACTSGESPAHSPVSASPGASAKTVVPAVAVVARDSGLGGYALSLVSVGGKVLASTHATWPYGGKCGPAEAGIISPPPVSTSNTRAYYLDTGGIKWLQEDGTTGLAFGPLAPRPNTAIGFAVSTDDSELAINTLDYSNASLVQHLNVTRVGSTSPGTEIYTATSPANARTAAVWPMAWHGGDIVLAYHIGTCTQGGGPGLEDADSYHIVDAATATRKATIGQDAGSSCGLMGLPTAAGIPCGRYDEAGTEVRTWTGSLRGTYGATFEPGGLSPSGNAYIGLFKPSAGAQEALSLIRREGDAVPIPGAADSALQPVLWIDDTHFFLGAGQPQGVGRVFSSSPEPLQAVQVSVAGDPVARIPGGLD
jgi:hypothetical protein